MKSIFFLLAVLFSAKLTVAEPNTHLLVVANNSKIEITTTHHVETIDLSEYKHCCTKDSLQLNNSSPQNKKLINGILSFPFPLGFLGAHRIMLGTKPWVPIVYVATFGGCFGILPLVDFCVLMLSNNTAQYENNPNVFMWIK